MTWYVYYYSSEFAIIHLNYLIPYMTVDYKSAQCSLLIIVIERKDLMTITVTFSEATDNAKVNYCYDI